MNVVSTEHRAMSCGTMQIRGRKVKKTGEEGGMPKGEKGVTGENELRMKGGQDDDIPGLLACATMQNMKKAKLQQAAMQMKARAGRRSSFKTA